MPKNFAEEHFIISEKFGYRKISPKTLVSLFSVELYSQTLPKKFVREPLFVSESLGQRKRLCSIGGYCDFLLNFFGLRVLKNFVGNPFKLPEIFGYRIFLCTRTENHVLHSKFFVSQYAKKSWERPLRFKMFGISETFLHITFLLRFFLSHSSEKLREEPSNVSESFKCQVSKKFMHKNGISRFSVENFSSQGAERFRWGTLRYTRKVRLSKNFMPLRLISLFSVEFFSRILPTKFVGEPFFVSESLGHRKFLCSVGGGGVAIFRWFFFGLPVLNIFVGNHFKLTEISGIETFYA